MRAKSSFLLELSQPSQSKPESAQERAKGWDVREFDDYVWVHVDEDQDGGKGGFWWIGRVSILSPVAAILSLTGSSWLCRLSTSSVPNGRSRSNCSSIQLGRFWKTRQSPVEVRLKLRHTPA